jgi:menaquinol-cytochrome c reductase iron-sulfur subunit
MMHEQTTQAVAECERPRSSVASLPRRDFLGLATAALGSLIAAVLGLPGLAYIFSPLRRKGAEGAFHPLTRLEQLEIGVPRSFAIVEERQDSWVKYPPEPVGSVWLIRQPEGSDPPVLALQSECPHLGCAVNLKADRSGFLCPCHTSAFTMDGTPTNQVPPRSMDRLEVKVVSGEVQVKYQRFRTATVEKTPLA